MGREKRGESEERGAEEEVEKETRRGVPVGLADKTGGTVGREGLIPASAGLHCTTGSCICPGTLF